MIRRLVGLVAGGAFALTSGGCLVMGGSSVQETGVRVSAATLDQIETGRTTEAWLVSALGEPTSRTTVPDAPNVQILRYAHVRREAEGGAVLFIFAGGSENVEKSTAYFEITDGVVTRYWTED